MVEATAREVSEAAILDALQYGHQEIRKIIEAEKELFAKVGVKKREFTPSPRDEGLFQEIARKVGDQLHDVMNTSKYSKQESHAKIARLRDALVESYPEPRDFCVTLLLAVLREIGRAHV